MTILQLPTICISTSELDSAARESLFSASLNRQRPRHLMICRKHLHSQKRRNRFSFSLPDPHTKISSRTYGRIQLPHKIFDAQLGPAFDVVYGESSNLLSTEYPGFSCSTNCSRDNPCVSNVSGHHGRAFYVFCCDVNVIV